jgi:hypothetical protein
MQPALLLALPFIVSASASSASTETLCESILVTAIGWTSEYEDEVCSAARSALQLLRDFDLDLRERVIVCPLDAQGVGVDPHLVGRFDAKTREIRILGFDDARAAAGHNAAGFGVPMSKDLWRSYIAHEIAHAVVDPYIAPNASHLRAAEYIAAVIQLTMLPQATRDAILGNYRTIAPWTSAREISPLYYFMAPAAFAVKSYRHFIHLPRNEQRIFVGELLRDKGGD